MRIDKKYYFQGLAHSTKVNGQECLKMGCFTTLCGCELLNPFPKGWLINTSSAENWLRHTFQVQGYWDKQHDLDLG